MPKCAKCNKTTKGTSLCFFCSDKGAYRNRKKRTTPLRRHVITAAMGKAPEKVSDKIPERVTPKSEIRWYKIEKGNGINKGDDLGATNDVIADANLFWLDHAKYFGKIRGEGMYNLLLHGMAHDGSIREATYINNIFFYIG